MPLQRYGLRVVERKIDACICRDWYWWYLLGIAERLRSETAQSRPAAQSEVGRSND